jgi:hypothetical protein
LWAEGRLIFLVVVFYFLLNTDSNFVGFNYIKRCRFLETGTFFCFVLLPISSKIKSFEYLIL